MVSYHVRASVVYVCFGVVLSMSLRKFFSFSSWKVSYSVVLSVINEKRRGVKLKLFNGQTSP